MVEHGPGCSAAETLASPAEAGVAFVEDILHRELGGYAEGAACEAPSGVWDLPQERWVEQQMERVLPMKCFHVVLRCQRRARLTASLWEVIPRLGAQLGITARARWT